MIYSIYLIIIILSYLLTLLLVPLNIRLSKRSKTIDEPHKRGVHTYSIPLAGGLSFGIVAIFLQFSVFVLFNYFLKDSRLYDQSIIHKTVYLALSGIFVMILGLMDDRKKFTAKYKLYFQIIIVCCLYFAGFKMSQLTNPFGADLNLGVLSFPMTLAWFLLVINAVNLIDGLDGLATGIGIIVNMVFGILGVINGNQFIAINAIIIVGALIAFLKYNFYPAKIFMGDTGSLFIGINIAALSVAGTQQFKGIVTITLLIPIIVLIIPLADTFLAIFRRVKRKVNIFEADKQHIHHRLLELGLSQTSIALISYFVTFLFGLIALGFSLISKKIVLAILLLISILLILIMIVTIKKMEKK